MTASYSRSDPCWRYFRFPRPLPPDLLFDPPLPLAAVPCAFASGVLGAVTGLSCCLSFVAAASCWAELSCTPLVCARATVSTRRHVQQISAAQYTRQDVDFLTHQGSRLFYCVLRTSSAGLLGSQHLPHVKGVLAVRVVLRLHIVYAAINNRTVSIATLNSFQEFTRYAQASVTEGRPRTGTPATVCTDASLRDLSRVRAATRTQH